MGAIIVKGGDATRRKVLEMFPAESIGTLTRALTRTIGESFMTNGMANPTMDETRRRFRILMDNVMDLRGERKWGVQRICSALPDILKCELNGGKYKPDDLRTTWIASDGD